MRTLILLFWTAVAVANPIPVPFDGTTYWVLEDGRMTDIPPLPSGEPMDNPEDSFQVGEWRIQPIETAEMGFIRVEKKVDAARTGGSLSHLVADLSLNGCKQVDMALKREAPVPFSRDTRTQRKVEVYLNRSAEPSFSGTLPVIAWAGTTEALLQLDPAWTTEIRQADTLRIRIQSASRDTDETIYLHALNRAVERLVQICQPLARDILGTALSQNE